LKGWRGPGEGVEVEKVGALLWNATLGFTTENDEGTGSVIIANRSVLEGRGCGALKKAGEIDPLKGRYWGGG
jgi:hypothetical protein